MDFSVEVQNVSFIIDAESEEEAIAEVEDRLSEIAVDWTEPDIF